MKKTIILHLLLLSFSGFSADCPLILKTMVDNNQLEKYEDIDQTVIDLKNEGVDELTIQQYISSIKFSAIMETPVLRSVFAEYFSKIHGLKKSDKVIDTWNFLSRSVVTKGLSSEKLFEEASKVVELMPKDFPLYSISNIDEIKAIMKKYGLTIDQYNQVALVLNSKDQDQKTLLTLAISYTLGFPDKTFVEQVALEVKKQNKFSFFNKKMSSPVVVNQVQSKSDAEIKQLVMSKISSINESAIFNSAEKKQSILSELKLIVLNNNLSLENYFFILDNTPFGVDWGSNDQKNTDYVFRLLEYQWTGRVEVDSLILIEGLSKVKPQKLSFEQSEIYKKRVMDYLVKCKGFHDKKSEFRLDIVRFIEKKFREMGE